MIRALLRFARDRRGHTAIEYGMLIGVGAIAIVTSLNIMGGSTKGSFEHVLAAFTGG